LIPYNFKLKAAGFQQAQDTWLPKRILTTSLKNNWNRSGCAEMDDRRFVGRCIISGVESIFLNEYGG
jgi:hypothetical protein